MLKKFFACFAAIQIQLTCRLCRDDLMSSNLRNTINFFILIAGFLEI